MLEAEGVSRDMRNRTVQLMLVALGLCGLGVALWDATMGGFYFRVLGIRISSWEAYKPFRLGILATIAAIWLHDFTAAPNQTCWSLFHRWAPWIAACIAVVSVAMAIHFGIFVAAGADAYGYVSQASLWAQGRLVVPDPLADVERVLGPAVAPLGYRLARTPGAIVPVYPAGLPLAMAIPLKIAGPSAVYYVVPIFGGIAVWLTYVLGARVDTRLTGMIAAVLIAFSPLFMFQTLVPMSDVPATTWWLLGWVLAISSIQWTPLGAGLAVSAAVLTRPNLVPLAIVLAAVVAAHKPRLRRLALFAAGSIPGCLLVAAINAHLYGSPLASGYGAPEAFYAWDRWPANLRRYAGWMIELNSPGFLLAFLAPLVARVRHALVMFAFFFVLLACYVFYLAFDTWPFLRFLLPAFPLLFVLASAFVLHVLQRLPDALRSTAVFLLCILLPMWYVGKAWSLTVFDTQRAEHRYPIIGEEIGRTLPANAIVLTVIESGSVRLYGKRMTARWDWIEGARFDDTVNALRRAGYEPYLLLEDWEIPLFRNYVGGVSQYGALDWPPALEYRDLARVDLYRLADRAQHRAGASIVTSRISYRR
jgi:hypothetical protein